MSIEDKWIVVALVAAILLHITIWLVGYFTNNLAYLLSFLNLAVAASIIIYWFINETRIQQHFIEFREIVVLLFAALIVASALYKIVSVHRYKFLEILQYIFFGIDIIIFIAALIFMLTFKITRLF